jgi:hypothetical protein
MKKAGIGFSFTVENVLVTGTPASVASVLTQTETKRVKLANDIYFLDAQGGDVIV